MAGTELRLQEHAVLRIRRPQAGDPFGRLPEPHPRVREPGRGQDVRVAEGQPEVVDRTHVVIGRVGLHHRVDRLVVDRVAPLLPLEHGEGQGLVQDGREAVDEGNLGHDRPEQLGGQVGDRAHQEAAGARPPGHQAVRGGESFVDEGPGAGHEIGEGRGLGGQLPLLVPPAAHLPAAPDVGDGEDEPAVEQAQPQRSERRVDRCLVRPVSVKEARRALLGACDEVGSEDEGDGHVGPVVGAGPASFRPVATGVEVAQDGLALHQRDRPRTQVQVEHRTGRDQRGVFVAEDGRVVLRVGTGPDGGGRLRPVDGPGGAGGTVHDPDAGQAALALVDDQVVGERVDAVQPDVGPSRDDLPPVSTTRSIVGCLHQAEVLGAVVGHDEEPAGPAGPRVAPVVVDGVLHPLTAGLDHEGIGERVVGVQCPDFGGHLGVQPHQDEAVVPGPAHSEVEAVVGLLVDQDVVGRVRAHAVTPELVRTHGLVHPHVEDGGVVVGPGRSVRGVLDRLGGQGVGVEVHEVHGVALAAGRVCRIGQPPVVGTDGEVAQGEVGVPGGQEVLVQDDLLIGGDPAGRLGAGPVGRPPAVDGVVASLQGAAVVEPAPLAHRHREVRLLDAGHDLVEQGLLQSPRAGHDRSGVGILRLEVRDDGGVVFVAEPVPLVDPGVAVGLEGHRTSLGHGGDRVSGTWSGGMGGGIRPGWHVAPPARRRQGYCRVRGVVTICIGEMVRPTGWPLGSAHDDD